jgi:HK97 gp10 family phage protein
VTITNTQVDGLQALLARLEQFPVELEKKVIFSALSSSAREISKIIPSQPSFPRRFGALARSIRVSGVRKGRVGAVLLITVGRKRTTTFKIFGEKAKVKEDAFYARFLEKGTKYITKREFFDAAINVGAPRAQRVFVAKVKGQLDRMKTPGSL